MPCVSHVSLLPGLACRVRRTSLRCARRGPIGAATDDEPGRGETRSAGQNGARLLRLSDETGSVVVDEVCVGGLERRMLSTDDVFIVDIGSDIFVWVGKGATARERQAISHA